jgi:hypothetical protein
MQTATGRYWIPPHVRVCPLLGSTILLDLERSRYFGIGTQEMRALSTLALNWDEASRNAVEVSKLAADAATPMVGALMKAGLLSSEAPTAGAIGTAPLDLSGVLASAGHELQRAAPLKLAHLVSFLAAVRWTRRGLRSRSLYSIACELRDLKSVAARSFDEHRAIELVGVFRRLRPHTFAAKDRCLFHALALVKFLSRHGVFPTWVIGVRARPWGAHSWVQQGKLLLDANPEQVCEFTPILAV